MLASVPGPLMVGLPAHDNSLVPHHLLDPSTISRVFTAWRVPKRYHCIAKSD